MKRVYLSLPIKNTGFTTKQRIEYANEIRRLLELRYDANNENVIVITPFDVNENEDKESYARKMGMTSKLCWSVMPSICARDGKTQKAVWQSLRWQESMVKK